MQVLGNPLHTVAPLRANLIVQAMNYATPHGDTVFAVPLFDSAGAGQGREHNSL